MDDIAQSDQGFTLGSPALVCRWRLAGGALPAENRHFRALSRRRIHEEPLSVPLVAWAKQHVEWTLGEGSAQHPDGVLMLVVDSQGHAAMTVGPYEPLRRSRLSDLIGRATVALREGELTGVCPESLWVVSEEDGALLWDIGEGCAPSGAASLVEDLARTLGIMVVRHVGLVEEISQGTLATSEAFLVSDEHGVVSASDAAGPEGRRFHDGYVRLCQKLSRDS